MKKGITVLAVLLIVVGTAPFINGVLLEKTVRRAFSNADAVNAAHGDVYTVELVRYERDFYSSEIEWKINFGPLKTVYGVEEVVFLEHARHGYTGAVSTTSLEKNSWFNTFITRELQGHNPFNLQTAYSYLGGLESTLKIEPFKMHRGEVSFDIGAGIFTLVTDAALQNFTSFGTWDGLGGNTAAIPSIGKITLESELELLSPYLWDGFMNFSLQKLRSTHPQGEIDLAALKVGSVFQVDPEKDTLSAVTSFACNGLTTAERAINRAEAQFSMKGMNTERYENFMKMYSVIAADLLRDLAALQDAPGNITKMLQEKTGILGFRLIAAFEELLQKDLELSLQNFLLELPEGKVEADITLRLLKDMSLMQFAPLIGTPEMALDVFFLNSNIQLPIKLVGEPELLLAPLYPGMVTGMFIKDGEFLRHRAETRHGKLFLNDREFVLSR
ncbi:MAG: DUF945 family protein [Desulfopila sp.]|jgi:uncharacterized protein YdgA (DUF945 family)|nr:DUF945 family protein [Desulfopila sp.]